MCTAFTPVLTDFMKDVGDKARFESGVPAGSLSDSHRKAVVFVSSDFTKEDWLLAAVRMWFSECSPQALRP